MRPGPTLLDGERERTVEWLMLSTTNAEGAPRIGELFAESFPHFEGLIVPFEAGQEVVGEGDPTESYYLVMRGMFRAVKFTRDGRRQVFAFYMPGDICGLEPDAVHKLTIEAVDAAAMAVLPRHACRIRMNDDPRLNAALFDGATRALTLSIDHMMMIGRSSAEERLAWFLTMLSARSAGPDALVLDLAMQRQDIADYLGLTIETVSRTFTLFRDRGFLKLPRKRRVEIVRPDALARLAAADRDAAAPVGMAAGSGGVRRSRSWESRAGLRLAAAARSLRTRADASSVPAAPKP